MIAKESLGRLAVVFLGIIALAEVIGLLNTPIAVVGDGSSGVAELRGELGELRDVRLRSAETLERIEQQLDLLSSGRIEPTTTPGIETPRLQEQVAPESLADLVRSLDALRASFERESASTQQALRESSPASASESGETTMFELRNRKTEPDWFALELLEQSWRTDPAATNRSQHFLTPKDLLRIYGPPTQIMRPANGMNFSYHRAENGAGSPTWSFIIQDGFVIRFFVKN